MMRVLLTLYLLSVTTSNSNDRITSLTVCPIHPTDPPSFLFDAIPKGWNRQLAGLLLWGHVAVSYAINSQALCSSMDRLLQATTSAPQGEWRCWWDPMQEEQRWFVLTLTVALSSYLVSNAVPFFKDLVALIGALTSVPLTLTLPALLYRKFHRLWLCFPSWNRPRGGNGGSENETNTQWCGSYLLLLYSLVFLIIGLMGALSSIDRDWLNHQGRPFACHRS